MEVKANIVTRVLHYLLKLRKMNSQLLRSANMSKIAVRDPNLNTLTDLFSNLKHRILNDLNNSSDSSQSYYDLLVEIKYIYGLLFLAADDEAANDQGIVYGDLSQIKDRIVSSNVSPIF